MEDVRKSRADEAFSSVTKEDVQQALNDLDRGVEHPFGPSSTYDLVYEGRRYPPKAVIALAAKTHSGVNLVPADFPGGEGTAAFDALRRLGFEIVPKEISTAGSVKFERLDCELFDRYPNSVGWAEVSKPDQEQFKSIRLRLKQIAEEQLLVQTGAAELRAGTSLATPNGRSPKDIWSCVYPSAAKNKSYAFQVALILSKRGAELCFCLGSGTSQIQDDSQRRDLAQGFSRAKDKLRRISEVTISEVEQRLRGEWFYRKSWRRDPPIESEFGSFSDWLEYATKPEVTSATVSAYMSPDELERIGEGIQRKFADAVQIFRPLLEFPYASSGFWIFQGNPARFDIDTYLRTRSEINWSVSQYEKAVHVGDRVLMWRSGADGGVIAECQITDGPSAAIAEDAPELRNPNVPPSKPGALRCKLRVINAFPDNVVPRQLIQSNLPELPIFKFAQNTNFPISADDYESILRLRAAGPMSSQKSPYSIEDLANAQPPQTEIVPYTKQMALNGLFLSENRFDELLDALREKKNIILQGAPGVGKTFIAKRLAYAFNGSKDPQRVEMIQFHQSYSYEDFIQGFRPKPNGHFELRSGIFYQFCRQAQRDESTNKPYVFIIDEINRGNLSKIFGELMMLIEPDKRGKDYAIPLTYSQDAEKKFYIPENVYLIGLMNTADRSLAMVDYALRRRFRFLSLWPEFTAKRFREYLVGSGVESKLIDKIVKRMVALNEIIAADSKNLGPGYQLGHSYFCPREGFKPDEKWYRRVIESEIIPLIQEYWFDSEQKVKDQRDALLS